VIERDKIERFQQRVEEIARVCAIPVINPYPRFARAAQNGEYAWHANGRWNHLGHRMVAQEIWGMTRKIAPREFADE
jgi:hypothetical protein